MKRLSVVSAICFIAALGLVVWLLPERMNGVLAAVTADTPGHYIFETIQHGNIELRGGEWHAQRARHRSGRFTAFWPSCSDLR
jgi:hypothetical protein